MASEAEEATHPRGWHLALALLILGLAAPGTVARAQEGNASQGAEIAEIQKIGGKVERDKAPDKPVVRVNLSITKAGDADLVHVKVFDKLKILNLNNTPITDAGLEHLKGLANLKELFVAGTKVGEDGAKELEEALPKLKIER